MHHLLLVVEPADLVVVEQAGAGHQELGEVVLRCEALGEERRGDRVAHADDRRDLGVDEAGDSGRGLLGRRVDIGCVAEERRLVVRVVLALGHERLHELGGRDVCGV